MRCTIAGELTVQPERQTCFRLLLSSDRFNCFVPLVGAASLAKLNESQSRIKWPLDIITSPILVSSITTLQWPTSMAGRHRVQMLPFYCSLEVRFMQYRTHSSNLWANHLAIILHSCPKHTHTHTCVCVVACWHRPLQYFHSLQIFRRAWTKLHRTRTHTHTHAISINE